MSVRTVAILGSTGSIGQQALSVIQQFPDRFRVSVLTAASSADLLVEQARAFLPDHVVLSNVSQLQRVRDSLADLSIRVSGGDDALEDVAGLEDNDVVLTALVGSAGLRPTMAAIRAGKRIALANKETLVMAGALIGPLSKSHGAEIIPIDSEHSAIFQCLAGEELSTVDRLTLTASGGPFRNRSLNTFSQITRKEALQHPTWTMGPKITIDSATMMNKGLEVIEAHWLFSVPGNKIDVLIHPQSIVHSMVSFVDGSIKAQLGVPDMHVPIQYALSYPSRFAADHPRVSWSDVSRLDFSEPEPERYPCLALAYSALNTGGAAPAILNAANETAVALFLQDSIAFTEIADLIEQTFVGSDSQSGNGLEDLVEVDAWARARVEELANVRVH